MAAEVIKLRPDREAAREHSQRSDDETIARFRAWWPGAPARVKRAIGKFVADEDAKQYNAEAIEVLEFLNSKRPGKRGFRASEANLRLIRARLADGITAQELRQIVVVKSRQIPLGEFDAKYLRPATLFSATHCDQYLGELEA